MAKEQKLSKTTIWRHKTGRTKKICPRYKYDHVSVFCSIAKKFFPILWQNHRQDIRQEGQLIAIETIQEKRIYPDIICSKNSQKNKAIGNGRDRIGIRLFSKAAQRRLYVLAKKYGYFREKNSASYIPRDIFIEDKEDIKRQGGL